MRVVVIGAGGFGREALDVAVAMGRMGADIEVVGVVDDAPSGDALQRLGRRGTSYLGSVSSWLETEERISWVVAVGAPAAREALAGRVERAGYPLATLVHPSASVGEQVRIGAGSVVCGGAQLSTEVTLGLCCHVNPGAIIGHDSVLADWVSVNPGAVISGAVRVGSGTLIGAGAVVLQNLTIGSGATVGASACVTRDVPDGATVKGVPAR